MATLYGRARLHLITPTDFLQNSTPYLSKVMGARGHHTYFFDGQTIGVEKTHILEGGGHRTYFVDGGTIGVGTPHNFVRTRLVDCLVSQ